jgi:hypothetical protein
MKDAKRNSATGQPETDWRYTPHEHEALLRIAEHRRKAQARAHAAIDPPLELRIARANDATA